MSERRIRFWKDVSRERYLAGDMKGFAEAERQIANWIQFERNEREALEVLDREGKQ